MTKRNRIARFRTIASQIVVGLYYCEVIHPEKGITLHTTAMYDTPAHAYSAGVEWVRNSNSKLARTLDNETD